MRLPRIGLRLVTLSLLATGAPCASALNGQFGLEFAVDAPWRLEPAVNADGSLTYGAIPIVVEFADANFEVDRGWFARVAYNSIHIGSLAGIRVREFAEDRPDVAAAETFISVRELQEIERKVPMSTPLLEPSRELCRPATGEDCAHVTEITHAHEFHAAAWYRPQLPVTPGRNILLEVTAVTERGMLPTDIVGSGNAVADPRVKVTLEWRNYVAVHAGESPLPRFASDWLYGDLHYHSQMTDNEGESGYSYRNTARALGAAGLDFVFATDHASGGAQQPTVLSSEARDLNEKRFAAAKRILYGPDGANEAIAREAVVAGLARVTQGKVVPQVYMGEEVDIVPEMSIAEHADQGILYGDNLVYRWTHIGLCEPETARIAARNGIPVPSQEDCRKRFSRPNPQRDTHFVFDEQGLPLMTDQYPARQHMVYLPTSSSLGSGGFIASATGPFGGGSKPIRQMLREIERGGFAFLAHPLESASPGSSNGPDIVPYSQTQLDDAWRSPAILGLEFWNENIRRASSAPDDEVLRITREPPSPVTTLHVHDFRWPFHGHRTNAPRWSWGSFNLWRKTAEHLYQGTVVWDRYLRKGLDPAQTRGIEGVGRDAPRKWFQAAGSDAHGDFNYRRAGRPGCGLGGLGRWCDNEINDTAIGNPRNLVSMRGRSVPGVAGASTTPTAGDSSRPRRYGNRQVIDALRSGNFAVTDGPAIRVVIDHNRNGTIEDSDFPMGSTVDFYPGEWIPVLVEWHSTPEFGPISQVDVYVGNTQVTFAPQDHGPIIVADYPGGNPSLGPYRADPSDALQVRLLDADGRFARTDVDAAARYHGVARLFIAPGQFQLAERDKGLFYVRAFAKTVSAYPGDWFGARNCKYSGDAGNSCGDRFAYTNPVWGRYNKSCPQRRPGRPPVAITQMSPSGFLDADQNGYPDVCEHTLLNPCDRNAATGGPDSGATRDPDADAPGRPGRPARRGDVAVDPRTINETATGETLEMAAEKPTPTISCQRLVALRG